MQKDWKVAKPENLVILQFARTNSINPNAINSK
jgi:hypothetical protein